MCSTEKVAAAVGMGISEAERYRKRSIFCPARMFWRLLAAMPQFDKVTDFKVAVVSRAGADP
jgi:hypothetical protein